MYALVSDSRVAIRGDSPAPPGRSVRRDRVSGVIGCHSLIDALFSAPLRATSLNIFIRPRRRGERGRELAEGFSLRAARRFRQRREFPTSLLSG